MRRAALCFCVLVTLLGWNDLASAEDAPRASQGSTFVPGPILAGYGQIGTSVLTLLVLYLSLVATYRLKMTDVLMENHRRYDALLVAKEKLQANGKSPPNEEKIKTYIVRFWNLQFDEFDCWRRGMIPTSTYTEWMVGRQQEWKANETIAGTWDYQRGWASVKARYTISDFTSFIEMVFYSSGSGEKGVKKAMMKLGPNPWRRFMSALLG